MGTFDVEWLLACDEPWTRYRTLVDLVGLPEDHDDVQRARAEMFVHPQVQALQDSAAAWPGHAIKRHNDAKLAAYALTTLADFGVRVDDVDMEAIVECVLASQSDDGPFKSLVHIPKAFGGSGEDLETWVLCDSSPILYTLTAMGVQNDAALQNAVDHLLSVANDVGWSCCAAAELGKFKGPGKRGDPCPIAVVWGLKALVAANRLDTDAAFAAAETLLTHYELRGQKKYFLFGIGTDFHKLKYPFIWYDILHVTDVLTQIPAIRDDSRLAEMVAAVSRQADTNGHYTATSMYMAWRGWSFADKRAPSPWLTLLAYRLQYRMVGAGSSGLG